MANVYRVTTPAAAASRPAGQDQPAQPDPAGQPAGSVPTGAHGGPAHAPGAAASITEGLRFDRIPVTDVAPVVDGGAFAAKAIPGEDLQIGATVFREGHDRLGATAVLYDPDGTEVARSRMVEKVPGTDRYTTTLRPLDVGAWSFTVESWADLYGTWEHDATIKIGAGVDVELMLDEGTALLERGAQEADRDAEDAQTLRTAAARLADTTLPAAERLAAGISPQVHAVIDRRPIRELVTATRHWPINVERERAGRASWYEFFPRSEGASYDPATGQWTSGTFRTAVDRLDAVAAMQFDVVYLPPIHPIGRTNRKGPNNTLVAGPGDPGSPWAIGAAEGGHDAIHPDLGRFEDFDAFVARTRELGMEVALDLALQCTPDHPWVTAHPEWFTTRIDGSIAFAENPPKKYQDIYPLNFDNDPEGLSNEVLRIVRLWMDHGVRTFRVDNPHTKPLWFWEWLIGQVNATDPDVVFLAEAFTRPPMMHGLGKAGFQQSYSYFTWRNTKEEILDYFTEVSHETPAFYRPNFFVNTPDILTEYLQYSGPAGFKIRAVLAATGSPLWGVYSGYELYEHVARPGAEEYIDNEKFEYRPRDWAAAEAEGRTLAPYLTRLNAIRRAHPALGDLQNLTVAATTDDHTVAYVKHKVDPDGTKDTVIVVVNLDPHAAREGLVSLDLAALDLDPADLDADGRFWVDDLLSGNSWTWGRDNYVKLDPWVEPAHVFAVRRGA
ncbi:alpha-1,4-glucan:maltose-1-phosphate maltosyltransferase 2 [Tersicoccus solisilvae]|uniref:Alpha-1,4-glucan:maltose-1-phosphate maltosyltransferase n=1 Tax=Tersicoccus solisilvae TaxID=1882339 RepID=A0ABQ1PPI4_9MICC|nr:alpha-1,4-glucan--maltose-1-phosphate maltosyltransferase [Tersicoccus solisilvae]GGD00483.1 alpha-1,4-glucan:maltose-1-phosphate maltosyltransferase 2 [Tersicoccus solisilvae]